MSETSYLGLFKHDNPETNMDKFDIDKALNQNWDKIDKGLEDAVSEFTAPISYKGQVATISDLPSSATRGDVYSVVSENKNYIWNGTAWVEYASTIDLSYLEDETKTNMQSGTAKELELTDSANAIASFNKVEGDTEQATRDGKNLINIYDLYEVGYTTTKNGVTFTILENGGIKVNGTPTSNTSIPIMGVYQSAVPIIVFDGDYVQSGVSDTISILYFNNTTAFANMFNNDTLNLHNTCDYAIFSVRKDIVYDNVIVYPQLEQGTTPTEYEQYGASPSPDYPSEIKNVGDNINLFDKTTVIANRAINYNNGNQSTADGYNASDFIKVKPNTRYTLDCVMYGSSSYGMAYYDKTKTYISGERINTEVVTPSNAEYFRFGVNSNSDLDTVQLKETKENLPYTPYNCGSIDFKLQNKNLFAGWKRNQRVDPTTGAITTSNNYLSSEFCNVKPNTNYYLSGVVTGDYSKNKFVSFYDINKNYISRSQSLNISNLQFTTPANAYYCIFTVNGSFADSTTMENFISDCSEIQIEKGNTATSYVSHQEQNIHFPLAEGQVLHEGDYLAEDSIHQTKRTIKLAISDMNNSESYPGWNNTPYIQNDYPEENEYLNAVTNYLSNISTENSDGISINTTNDRNVLYLSTNIFNLTQTQWKSQYPNLIFELQYELAEEIVTPYTTEQKEAYYQLKHFLTYEGYTLIECIDNMKPDIQVNYLYNNKVNNYYGNIIYELENRLHELEIS